MDTPKKYIRKYWFGISRETELGDFVLLMERDRVDQFKAALFETTNQFSGVFKGITGVLGNHRISIIHSIGPAHIADCVSFLAYAFPVKGFFSTGSIGGLDTEMGDVVVSIAAGTQDGFSLNAFNPNLEFDDLLGNYAWVAQKVSCIIDEEVRMTIRNHFNCNLLKGKIFTIPCVALENPRTLERIKELGYVAIDLESGPFLAACRKSQIPGICIHWVTDLPLTRDFYYSYYGIPEIVKTDWEKKHIQWLNYPKLILPILHSILNNLEV